MYLQLVIDQSNKSIFLPNICNSVSSIQQLSISKFKLDMEYLCSINPLSDIKNSKVLDSLQSPVEKSQRISG